MAKVLQIQTNLRRARWSPTILLRPPPPRGFAALRNACRRALRLLPSLRTCDRNVPPDNTPHTRNRNDLSDFKVT
jgi:hypothetical protein